MDKNGQMVKNIKACITKNLCCSTWGVPVCLLPI